MQTQSTQACTELQLLCSAFMSKEQTCPNCLYEASDSNMKTSKTRAYSGCHYCLEYTENTQYYKRTKMAYVLTYFKDLCTLLNEMSM